MTLNRLSGLVVAIMGAVLIVWVIPHQTEIVDSGWLKPATLPGMATIIILIGGLIQFVFPAQQSEIDLGLSRRMGLFFGITLAGIYLMKWIGFVIAAPVLISVIMIMIKERRPIWLASGIILLPAAIWFCVEFLLKKPLP